MPGSEWNMKQTVAGRIVAQQAESTPEKQKEIIIKLLEQVKPEFLIALDFAYGMTEKSPAQCNNKKTS
jgi:hypothetical protein